MKNKTDEARDAARDWAWHEAVRESKTVRAMHIEDCRMFFDAGVAFAGSSGGWVRVGKLEAALRRIDINYRESSGLALHIQAYCMRSEAKAALDPSTAESWTLELADIKAVRINK